MNRISITIERQAMLDLAVCLFRDNFNDCIVDYQKCNDPVTRYHDFVCMIYTNFHKIKIHIYDHYITCMENFVLVSITNNCAMGHNVRREHVIPRGMMQALTVDVIGEILLCEKKHESSK